MTRAVALVTLAAAAGCGGQSTSTDTPPHPPSTTPKAKPPAPRRPRLHVQRARCTPGAGNCRAATGRILYLELVDPDWDGDLHVVLAGGNVTFPGISVLDVSKELRPKRDPRVGDLASGAGPVYTGSHGQQQIQVTEVHFAYR